VAVTYQHLKAHLAAILTESMPRTSTAAVATAVAAAGDAGPTDIGGKFSANQQLIREREKFIIDNCVEN
jgi:hypothetical protein